MPAIIEGGGGFRGMCHHLSFFCNRTAINQKSRDTGLHSAQSTGLLCKERENTSQHTCQSFEVGVTVALSILESYKFCWMQPTQFDSQDGVSDAFR